VKKVLLSQRIHEAGMKLLEGRVDVIPEAKPGRDNRTAEIDMKL